MTKHFPIVYASDQSCQNIRFETGWIAHILNERVLRCDQSCGGRRKFFFGDYTFLSLPSWFFEIASMKSLI